MMTAKSTSVLIHSLIQETFLKRPPARSPWRHYMPLGIIIGVAIGLIVSDFDSILGDDCSHFSQSDLIVARATGVRLGD